MSSRTREDSATDFASAGGTPQSSMNVGNVSQKDQNNSANAKSAATYSEIERSNAATPSPKSSSAISESAVATPAPAALGQRSASGVDEQFEKWRVGNRYKLMRTLGHGSYGQVAEAEDTLTKKRVAVKWIENVFDQEIDTKRILREVYILRHLRHENVIHLLDIFVPPKDPFNEIFLIFEFVDTDLHKLINSPQYLTIDHVKSFLYQILCGLMYIHSSLVIHRDVKPANILLSEDCGLKICDFGLARVVPASKFLDEDSARVAARAEEAAWAKRKRSRPSGSIDHGISKRRNVSPDDDSDVLITDALENDEGMPPPAPATPRKLQRQLTKHVVTRWYRPPELILLQDYTNGVDMWSTGCIFAELLGMQKENVKHYKRRKPLFPGKSCFPLSADNEKTYKDRLDQLNVIFDVIGTPEADEVEHLGEVRNYLKALPKKTRVNFKMLFRGAPDDAIDLLNQMLVFDPRKRISIADAIEHPFLSAVRQRKHEFTAPEGLLDDFDLVDLSRDQLKAKLIEEIQQFQSQAMIN